MSKQQRVATTPWWRNKKIIIWIVVIAVLVAIVFIVLLTTAQAFHWQIGFTSSQKTTTTTEVTQPSGKKVTTTIENLPAKTLWDWLPLLIQLLGALAIPVVVGFGTAFFARQQAKTSEASTENQQQEELLRTYFDKISDLLLNKELSTNPNMQSIVRARTLAALHILNPERKAIILRFLYDSSIEGHSNLLQYVKGFLYSLNLSHTDLNRIDLSGADLGNANLNGADLGNANLSGTNLRNADLSGANLREADLRNADLSGANFYRAALSEAKLRGTDLIKTNLREAKLYRAVLIEANFFHADLSRADLRYSNFYRAKLIEANFFHADFFHAIATPEQFTSAKNMTPKQLAHIVSPGSVSVELTTVQPSTTPRPSERKSGQTSQEEAVLQKNTLPKQDTDVAP